MIRRALLSLAPLVLGIAALAATTLLAPDLPMLRIRVSLGMLIFLAGLLLSAGLLAVLFFRCWSDSRLQTALERERACQAESRRRFLRRLDHELKNPLTGIRAALVNIEAAPAEGAPSTALPDIQRHVKRLSDLTADLRKLADLEEIKLDRIETDLGGILEEAVDVLRSLPSGSGRGLHLVIPRVPWPLPAVMADSDLLAVAFFNLIDNALKYSRDNDVIEVRAMEHDHSVQVDIADTGPGISPEELPKIFEELYRGSNARGSEGSGLGLALARRIIERHGGRISVRSRADGIRGTVFTVLLPAAESAQHVTKR